MTTILYIAAGVFVLTLIVCVLKMRQQARLVRDLWDLVDDLDQ